MEAVRGARVAHPRRDRSRGLRCRPVFPARSTRTPSSGWSKNWRPSTRRRAPAPRRRPVRGAGAGTDRSALSRQSAGLLRKLPGQRHQSGTSWWSSAGTGSTPVRRIGSGKRGLTDGPAERARFSEPQGLALLPDDSVIVADTCQPCPGVAMTAPATGAVTTLAATGRQRRHGEPASAPLVPSASPRPGTSPRARPGGSPWPGCTSRGRTIRREETVTSSPRRRPTRDSSGRARTRGAVRTAGAGRCRRSGCGWPTPKRPPCAGWTSMARSARRSAPNCSTSASETAQRARPCSSTPGHHRPARRVGGDQRHLPQQRPAPLRPEERRGQHARDRPARTE